MVKQRAALLAWVAIALAVSACSASDSPSPTPGGADNSDDVADAPPGGEATGGQVHGDSPFRAFVHVMATAAPNAKKPDVPVVIEVQLARDGQPVVGAEVVGGPLGKPAHATPKGVGTYVIELAGYAPWYEISITSNGTTLDGVRLRAPAFHSIAVPQKPKKNQPTTIRWNPNKEDVVSSVDLKVVDAGNGVVLYDEYVTDSGEVELPATVVPEATSIAVEVRRSTLIPLALADSAAVVDLTAATGAIAP